jgi:secreted trypsin-like serine protease
LDLILRAQKPIFNGDKIVGGEIVEPNSIPWQIALLRSGSLSCGGSIYKENIIICAAHCVDGALPALYTVVAGQHNLQVTSGLEQNRAVYKFVVNENYGSARSVNDISLIFLSSNIDLSVDSAKPVTLPPPTWDAAAGVPLIVTGWGTMRSGGQISQELRQVTVPAVSQDDCKKAYGVNRITDDMICAGDLIDGGVDSCQGDSGGPLVTVDSKGNATNQLVGIVSWGSGCASPGFPGVYARVTYFLEWIAANAV